MLTYRPRKATKRIILHDSHTPNDMPNVAAHMRTQGRALGLLDVGYHWVIERNGDTVGCRAMGAMGSHTPGNNHDSLGVCLAGSGEFTAEQYDSLAFLFKSMADIFGDTLRLEGHYEVQRYRNPKRPRCPCCDMDEVRRIVMQ